MTLKELEDTIQAARDCGATDDAVVVASNPRGETVDVETADVVAIDEHKALYGLGEEEADDLPCAVVIRTRY